MQAVQVGVFRCPVRVAISCGKSLLESFQRFCPPPKHAVAARRIVECVGVAGTKSHRRLQVPDGFLSISGIRKIPRQQNTGAHILGHQFQLLPKDCGLQFAQVVAFFFAAQLIQNLLIRDINVVIVAIRLDSALRQRCGFFISSRTEVRASENVPRPLAIRLAFDSPPRQQRSILKFLLRVKQPRARPALPAGPAQAPSPDRTPPAPFQSSSGFARESRK